MWAEREKKRERSRDIQNYMYNNFFVLMFKYDDDNVILFVALTTIVSLNNSFNIASWINKNGFLS